MEHDWTYQAEVRHVVDGDTYDMCVDLGFGTFKDIRVRLLGVDTAETYGVPKESDEFKEGKEHTRFVRDWFESSEELVVRTHKDEKGKYGRYLVEVVNEDGENLSDVLIEEYPSVER